MRKINVKISDRKKTGELKDDGKSIKSRKNKQKGKVFGIIALLAVIVYLFWPVNYRSCKEINSPSFVWGNYVLESYNCFLPEVYATPIPSIGSGICNKCYGFSSESDYYGNSLCWGVLSGGEFMNGNQDKANPIAFVGVRLMTVSVRMSNFFSMFL